MAKTIERWEIRNEIVHELFDSKLEAERYGESLGLKPSKVRVPKHAPHEPTIVQLPKENPDPPEKEDNADRK